ncbi:MAG: bifunctional homocysteine S-methyltransferase/methylenetetrahydrofolate reductase [Phycisphaerae bacterium]|jgi:homocysteine S-methyltransferase
MATKNYKGFRELLAERVIIGDGAMGTMLYEQGTFLNQCFEEVNLTHPDKVEKIHRQYYQAGADFVETNTFGANEFKLARFGLAEQTQSINKAAVEIARRAVDSNALVAGSIGPLGKPIEPYGTITREQAQSIFANQAKALIDAGVDFIILETFSNTDEIIAAIEAVSRLSDIPIVAQMTFTERDEPDFGKSIIKCIGAIASLPAVTAVGMNCSVGPAAMLGNLDIIRGVTDKPIAVQSNAGLPQMVDNRSVYMCTPEYMAEYAKKFYEKGARIIGGCCGTTPRHIKEIARAVRGLDKAAHGTISMVKAEPKKVVSESQAVAPLQLAQKSAWGRKIAEGQKVATIELTPPHGVDIQKTLEKARACAKMGIDAINLPDGPRASSRVSAIATAVKIEQETGIETIAHFCCRDRNIIGMQSDLLGAHLLGLRNLLIITGDPPKLGEYPTATGVFDMDSIALTSVVRNLNAGIDIAGNRFSPGTGFTLGVGANPVAVDIEREIEKFRQKVLAGAEYAITQPVFDVSTLLEFIERIEEFKIPIVAGIWPFTSAKNAEFMANEVPGVVVPEKLLGRMSETKTKEQARQTGIQIAGEIVEQIQDRVAGFAVSAPFGNVETALLVLGKSV